MYEDKIMKTSMNTTKATAICSVFGLLTAFVAPASQADEKVYPGSQCRAYYSFAQGNTRSDYIGMWNINGFGEDGVYIVCPIVRDNVSNMNGTRSAKIMVFNQRGINDEKVSCGLWSNSQNGGTVALKAAYAEYNGDNELNVDVDASASGGIYGLTCFLPPQSGIWSYRIDEY
jgi:hypothetical protein